MQAINRSSNSTNSSMDFSIDIKSLSLTKKITIGFSIALLILALTQPAFYIDREDHDAWANSFLLFTFGWSFILGGSTESLIWWANPLYITAIFFLVKNRKISIIFSLSALALASSFMFLNEIMTSESGQMSRITELKLGYKMWVLSFAVLLIGTLVDLLFDKTRNNSRTTIS